MTAFTDRDSSGRSILMCALENNHDESIIKTIIDLDQNVINCTDNNLDTAAMYALRNRYPTEFIMSLTSDSTINSINYNGLSLLTMAFKFNTAESILDSIIQLYPDRVKVETKALLLAIETENASIVRKLIENGMDVTTRINGKNPALYAAASKNGDVLKLILDEITPCKCFVCIHAKNF